jgi:outer membrane protein OmpA-like peptidoglycan-associated protein
LEQLANLLLANDEHIEIVGHTDNRGQEEDNQVLSESRALAVRNYLHDRGVPLERMKHSGQGADSPIATNETEAGRALNRRTEIIVIE